MEFVHGMSVRQMIEEGPMAVPDAIHVMLQVLDALASAHEQGIIHQDIKPANILLTPQMHAKVTDFGISRFANADTTSISSSMGTPSYMAPEQCRGGAVDHRADLFAAGATLFEMVAGERAFGGRSPAEVTHHIMYDRLPLLPAAVRGAAPRLQFVLERAMGKQPEDRFSSGHEMAEALRQILGTLAAEAQDKMPRPSAGMTATVSRRRLPPPDSRRRRPARHRWPCRGPIANGRAGARSLAHRCRYAPDAGTEAYRLPGADRAGHGAYRRRSRAGIGHIVHGARRGRARRQRAR